MAATLCLWLGLMCVHPQGAVTNGQYSASQPAALETLAYADEDASFVWVCNDFADRTARCGRVSLRPSVQSFARTDDDTTGLKKLQKQVAN
jgi:hypothetical protein